MDDYAGDVIDLLDALHIQEAVIGGLSMGGYVAFAILRHAARYFQGLILADTRSQADTPEGVEGRTRMLRLVQDKGPSASAEEMLPKLLGETTRTKRPDVVERVRSLVLSSSADRSEEHTSELQSHSDLVCRLLLEKKKSNSALHAPSHRRWQAARAPVPTARARP